MNSGRLFAIVLSAGWSRRMGDFKPLMPLGAATVVERVVGIYRTAGIEDLCVVVGHQADQVTAALAPHGVHCRVNPDFGRGMYSSVVTGLAALPGDCSGFFVHPVDIPLVRPGTVKILAEAFSAFPDAVHHPVFDGRRGHPPLVPAALAPVICRWSGKGGLRGFWGSGSAPMRDVPVADEGVLLDLDTGEDYRRISARVQKEDIPTAAECRVLMDQVHALPDAVRRHCRAVAAVAVQLAEALIRAGVSLDLDLVRSAALVHDIARDQPHHATAGAELLEGLGFPRLAAVVRVHMDLEVDATTIPDEAGLVFLADKLVVGHRRATLAERFERKMAKYGKDLSAAAAIERRRRAAMDILATVERTTGLGLESILQDLHIDGECVT